MVRRWIVLLALLGSLFGATTTSSAAAFAYDLSTNARADIPEFEPEFEAAGVSRAPVSGSRERSAAPSVEARGASATPDPSVVATEAVRSTSIVDDVIAETQSGARNLTSRYTLTADEALTAGERWVGSGYMEIGKPGSGVFRSADGTRQFRIDNGSITGAHSPGVPHVHLETIAPGSKVPVVNNHIPIAG